MRAIVLTAVAIAAISVAAPGLLQRGIEIYGKSAPSAAARQPSTDFVEGGVETNRELALKAERDGHFYVEADINRRPVRLVVDTGATVVALRRSDAARAGIRVIPADFDTSVSTANGRIEAARVEIDRIAVAEIEVENVEALVLPDDKLPISLLGGSFLNRLDRFEVRKGTLIFEN